jgi:diadenylate cyclase
MPDTIRTYFENLTFLRVLRDALDIFLVYYLVYRALLVLRGTRAMQVGLGLGVVFLIYLVARYLQLVTVFSILNTFIAQVFLIIIVVFQSDIRRGLQRVGSRAWLRNLSRSQEMRVIDAVVEASTELARHRIGAIITFEQDANLDEFVGVHKGHVIDAQVSPELLVSLFLPEGMNKLHDGAVVIRNFRIAKAGVFFPMNDARLVDESFGSRHRAALGITEETDAVVVIVSEERGTISFCFNGNIASNLDGPKLRTMLEAMFRPEVRKKRGRRKTETKRDSQELTRTVPDPRSTRDTRDTEVMHPRISLVADSTPADLPPSTQREPSLLHQPMAGTPPSGKAAPLRTPVPIRTPTHVDPEKPEGGAEPGPHSE